MGRLNNAVANGDTSFGVRGLGRVHRFNGIRRLGDNPPQPIQPLEIAAGLGGPALLVGGIAMGGKGGTAMIVGGSLISLLAAIMVVPKLVPSVPALLPQAPLRPPAPTPPAKPTTTQRIQQYASNFAPVAQGLLNLFAPSPSSSSSGGSIPGLVTHL